MYERDEGSKNSREEIRTEIVPKKENAAADQYVNNKKIKKTELTSRSFPGKDKRKKPFHSLCLSFKY